MYQAVFKPWPEWDLDLMSISIVISISVYVPCWTDHMKHIHLEVFLPVFQSVSPAAHSMKDWILTLASLWLDSRLWILLAHYVGEWPVHTAQSPGLTRPWKTVQAVQSHDMPRADYVTLAHAVLPSWQGNTGHLQYPRNPSLCVSGHLPSSNCKHLGLFLAAVCEPFQSRVGSAWGISQSH